MKAAGRWPSGTARQPGPGDRRGAPAAVPDERPSLHRPKVSKASWVSVAGEWRAKNVTSILYREYRRHRYLHETLREWAGIYRDGIGGKEGVVVRHAGSLPWASTKQDDYVGRVLWALSDPSGVPARCFADLDPVPSLEWLEPPSEDRYRQADLDRFGVPPRGKRDKDLAFSLIRRPWPYTHAPWMALVDESVSAGRWDDVMFHLGRWHCNVNAVASARPVL